MHRRPLLDLLAHYRPYDRDEHAMYDRLCRFVEQEPRCFERSLATGHITGSAWIVDHARTHVLLTHHRKLDRWLQLGGHADGETDILNVALREAREESGLEEVTPLSNGIFDIDVHVIPAREAEPEHLHFDVRWLLEADRNPSLVVSSESKDLAWVDLNELHHLSTDRSMLRMAEKLKMGRGTERV